MPKSTQQALIQQVHDSRLRMALAVTGGGSSAISGLLGTPGASRTVLAAAVPYAESALAEWLGAAPDGSCSARTARAMAMAAFQKARAYDPSAAESGAVACGVACTASLASDRPKKGPHRAHLAYQTGTTTAEWSVMLEKGLRSRAEEEAIVADLLLNLIAEAAGVDARLDVSLTDAEPLHINQTVAPSTWQALLAGDTRAVPCHAAHAPQPPAAVFPGAFNPLHSGHRTMAQIAGAQLGCSVAFEVSTANVDKPPLDFIEIGNRLEYFDQTDCVWLSRAPLFTEKASLFPGATFVVGADTIWRIGHVRYYGDRQAEMDRAIDQIAAAGCRFLVFGRTIDRQFRSLSALELPATLAALCQEVPEATFRDDISSTELRRRQEG